MNVVFWEDGNKNKIKIKDMSDKHIKNCIKQTKNGLKGVGSEGKICLVEKKDEGRMEVFDQNWCRTHGVIFLKAFEAELKRRGY